MKHIPLVAICCLYIMCSTLHAQKSTRCQLPEELRATGTLNSALLWNSAGAWFTRRHNLPCAEDAFKEAIKLSPKAWLPLYDLGIIELLQHNNVSAILHLSEAAALKPDSSKPAIALGHAYDSSGKTSQAEVQFRNAIKIDPNSVEALDSLSQILASRKLYSAAIGYWTQAISLAPGNPYLAISRAVALSNNGDLNAAISSLQTIAKTHPQLALAHFDLGTVYAKQNAYQQAADEYNEALRLNPSDAVTQIALAKCYFFLSEYARVPLVLRDYVLHHPKDFQAHYLLGVAYRNLQQYANAEDQLLRAAAIDSNHSDLQFNLGVSLLRTGQIRAAVTHLEKAIHLNPDAEAPRVQLANALKLLNESQRSENEYRDVRQTEQINLAKNEWTTEGSQANRLLSLGQPDKAAEIYSRMLRQHPNDAHTYYNLALALGTEGKTLDERKALESAVALDGTIAEPWNALGALDMTTGRTEDASREFTKALQINPQLPDAQVNLAVIEDGQGRTKQAENLLRRAIENNPKYPKAYIDLGLILAQEERFHEAEARLRQAVALQPTNAQAMTALGKVQARTGQIGAALESFRKVVLFHPNDSESHLNLGIALADHMEIDAALKQFNLSTQLDPQSAAAHYNRGRLLLDERHYEDAEPELKTASQLDPQSGDTFYLLAITERQLSHTGASLWMTERSIKLDPNNSKAYYLLGQNLQSVNRVGEAIIAWKHAVQIDPRSTESLYKLSQVLRAQDASESDRYAALLKAQLARKQATTEADTLGSLALAAADNHDYRQAVDQLKKAIVICGKCPDRATLEKDLGLVEARSGDEIAAARELRAAESLNSNDPDVEKALTIVTQHQTGHP